ncbi:MAG TPA: Hpt domain-containing protein [Pyrinomonadaceae bacterium]|jgi:chemotaxis protein histidine kinase CheA|nr:Hpt domain-containing protein [Pyrinomonadaceae bacterium]
MEKVPAEFLEDAINDLSEISSELRSITIAGDQTLPPLFSKKLFRLLHTIKGSAQTFGLEGEAQLAHDTETYLAALKEDPVGEGAAGLLTAALDILSKNLVLIAEGNAPNPILDIVWDAVKKAGGSVKVDSNPGGARFEITLPL